MGNFRLRVIEDNNKYVVEMKSNNKIKIYYKGKYLRKLDTNSLRKLSWQEAKELVIEKWEFIVRILDKLGDKKYYIYNNEYSCAFCMKATMIGTDVGDGHTCNYCPIGAKDYLYCAGTPYKSPLFTKSRIDREFAQKEIEFIKNIEVE